MVVGGSGSVRSLGVAASNLGSAFEMNEGEKGDCPGLKSDRGQVLE